VDARDADVVSVSARRSLAVWVARLRGPQLSRRTDGNRKLSQRVVSMLSCLPLIQRAQIETDLLVGRHTVSMRVRLVSSRFVSVDHWRR
jgi:hypothetical protein